MIKSLGKGLKYKQYGQVGFELICDEGYTRYGSDMKSIQIFHLSLWYSHLEIQEVEILLWDPIEVELTTMVHGTFEMMA